MRIELELDDDEAYVLFTLVTEAHTHAVIEAGAKPEDVSMAGALGIFRCLDLKVQAAMPIGFLVNIDDAQPDPDRIEDNGS